MSSNTLERWMYQALALGERGRGFVEPNPLVGAVVLEAGGSVVGEGWHQKFGGPHAEIVALNAAGERARGGTLVVTLEPCCHHGKTPPCTDAVLKSGVRRVVAAMADPFPKVAGGGLRILRDSGLEVQVGLCQEEARWLNAPYLKFVGTGKPWVHLKWAMTLDGKIATRTGDSKWISGEAARRRVHELRGRMDAIIVGRRTVAADDPLLTTRPPGPRVASRVVITASGELPATCRLLATVREAPLIVYTNADAVGKLGAWSTNGAEIVPVPMDDTGLPVDVILADMGRRGYTNVLVEGGAGLLGSFLDANLADEFHVFVAPQVIGGAVALSPVGGVGRPLLSEALRLAEFTAQACGNDAYLHGFAEASRAAVK